MLNHGCYVLCVVDMRGMVAKLKVGDIHKAHLKKRTDIGVICELENGVKAVATSEHIEGIIINILCEVGN